MHQYAAVVLIYISAMQAVQPQVAIVNSRPLLGISPTVNDLWFATNESLGLQLSPQLHVLSFIRTSSHSQLFAEDTGRIQRGDHLIQANDVTLEYLPFTKALAVVSQKQTPRMFRFRPREPQRLPFQVEPDSFPSYGYSSPHIHEKNHMHDYEVTLNAHQSLGLQLDSGLRVRAFVEDENGNSQAKHSGISLGDRIVAIDGYSLEGFTSAVGLTVLAGAFRPDKSQHVVCHGKHIVHCVREAIPKRTHPRTLTLRPPKYVPIPISLHRSLDGLRMGGKRLRSDSTNSQPEAFSQWHREDSNRKDQSQGGSKKPNGSDNTSPDAQSSFLSTASDDASTSSQPAGGGGDSRGRLVSKHHAAFDGLGLQTSAVSVSCAQRGCTFLSTHAYIAVTTSRRAASTPTPTPVPTPAARMTLQQTADAEAQAEAAAAAQRAKEPLDVETVSDTRYYPVTAALFGGPFSCRPRPFAVAKPLHACEPLQNRRDVMGAVVLVGRGDCFFSVKAKMVQDAGGVAVVVHNSDDSIALRMPAGPDEEEAVVIGAGMVSRAAGRDMVSRWRGAVGGASVAQFKVFEPAPDRDTPQDEVVLVDACESHLRNYRVSMRRQRRQTLKNDKGETRRGRGGTGGGKREDGGAEAGVGPSSTQAAEALLKILLARKQ